MVRVRVLGFCAAALAALLAGEAQAQTAFCADLQRQYAIAVGGSGGGGGLSAEGVARQLTKQKAAAAANGCGGYGRGRPATAQCPPIMGSINQLQRQLAQAQAAANGQRSAAGPSPAVVHQRLVRNGCVLPQTRMAAADGGLSLPGGGARTLCVRTCDGYFFPVGNASRRDRFKTDAEACQSMYAQAGEAELFVQRRRDDIATAVSVDGKQTYADQPYAFLFRHVFSASCQAQLKGGLAALGMRYYEALRAQPPKAAGEAAEVAASSTYWLPPRLRPQAVGEDPETVAVRAGGLEALLRPPADAVAVAALPIRRVGETWYADLYDPDQPPAPQRDYRPPLGFDLIGAAMAAETAALPVEVPTQ